MKLNLKKLFTLIFVLLLCFTMTTLTSCNEENDDPSNSPSGEVTSWKDSVVFESDSFVYDGEAKKIEVKNAPEGAKVSYRNNNKKDPGEYKVTATIEYNGEFLYLNAVLTINSLSSTLSAEANQTVVFYGGTVLPEFELDNDVQTVGYIVYDKEGNELPQNSIYKPGEYVVEIFAEKVGAYAESNHVKVNLKVVQSKFNVTFDSIVCDFEEGKEYKVEVKGELPTGYTVEYKDNVATEAGCYYASAKIKDSEGKVVETLTSTMEINNPENAEFAAYLDEFFIEYLEGDQLSVNIFCEDINNFPGLTHYDAKWYTYTTPEEGEVAEAKSEFEKLLAELEEYKDLRLSDLQLVAYRNVESFLNYYIDYYSIKDSMYMDILYVDQFGGYVADFGTYMEAYDLRSEQEVIDVVDYIESTKEAFPSYLVFLEEKTNAGYPLSDFTIDEMSKYLYDVLKEGENYYLKNILTEKINKLEFLDDAKKADYSEQVSNAIKNHFIPGVQELYDGLDEFKGKLTGSEGYWAVYDQGKEKYLLRLNDLIGVNASNVEQYIKELDAALSETTKLSKEAQGVMFSENGIHTQSDLNTLLNSSVICKGTPEEMMEYLKEFAPTIVPELKSNPEIVIKQMDKASAKVSNAVAYYMKSSLDNTGAEYITLNPNKLGNYNDVLGTLAHEGYPGHLYAYVYSKEMGLSNLSTIMTSTAHGEGWATYVELALYQYAKEKSNNRSFDTVMDYLYANQLSSFLLESRIDVGIHYEGWTVEDVEEYLTSLGYGGAEGIYRLIIEMPTQYAAYGYGKLVFYNLHKEAKAVLGNYYDEVEFNAMLLSKGWTDLGELKNTYRDYMTKKCHQVGIEFNK